MPHPALDLGWFTLCIRTQSFEATRAFYEALGFRLTGGQPEQGWAAMCSGRTEITLMSFLSRNLVNLRGGNVIALADDLASRGCDPFHSPGFDPTSPERESGPRHFDPKKWPSEFSTDKTGQPITEPGAGDFLLADPDGNLLYFDSVPLERVRFAAGERFAGEDVRGELQDDQLDLGRFVLQLRVADLATSRTFYEKLGLRELSRNDELGYLELGNDLPVPFRIGLNAKSANDDVMLFECPDVDAVFAALVDKGLEFRVHPSVMPDGSKVAVLEDPEGNTICLRQAGRS